MRSQPLRLTLCLCLCCTTRAAEAARDLTAEVRQEDRIILRASFGIPDHQSVAAAWNVLDRQVFHEVLGSLTSLEEVRPTLSGNLELVLQESNHELLSVQLQRLDVRRVPGTINQWKLPRSEVERTATLGGIELPAELSWATVLLIAFLGAVSVGSGWIFWNRSRTFENEFNDLDD